MRRIQTMNVRTLLGRGRRKFGYVLTTRREQSLVTETSVVPVSSAGKWRWFHTHPVASRAEVRRRHLRAAVEALEAADVNYFVVPGRAETMPQIGLLECDLPRGWAALHEALRGRAWYAQLQEQEHLLDVLPVSPEGAATVYPRYRVPGSAHLTGAELGVTVVPWHRRGQVHVPATPTGQVGWLRDADLSEGEVCALGERWRSLAIWSTPQVDDLEPLTWIVEVPRPLRSQAPEVADRLAAGLTRSLWFYTGSGSEIVVLDDEMPSWCRGEGSPRVRLRRPDEDPARALVAVWTDIGGPAAVVAAGALVLRDLPPARVVTPGGLAYLRPEETRLDARPADVCGPGFREARQAQPWFHARTGAWMPWAPAPTPQGLPALTPELGAKLDLLLEAPDRPGTPAAAALVPLWAAFVSGVAVPGSSSVVAIDAMTRSRKVAGRLATQRRRADAAFIDPLHPVDPDTRLDLWTTLLDGVAPVPAPWELR
jgi:hypothetical protein